MSCVANVSPQYGFHPKLHLRIRANDLPGYCHFAVDLTLSPEFFVDSYELQELNVTLGYSNGFRPSLEEPTLPYTEATKVTLGLTSVSTDLEVIVPLHMRYPLLADTSYTARTHSSVAQFAPPSVSWDCMSSGMHSLLGLTLQWRGLTTSAFLSRRGITVNGFRDVRSYRALNQYAAAAGCTQCWTCSQLLSCAVASLITPHSLTMTPALTPLHEPHPSPALTEPVSGGARAAPVRRR